MLNPRASGNFITSHARNVRILESGIVSMTELIVDAVNTDAVAGSTWNKASDLHPIARNLQDKNAIDWCFYANSINFSFWTEGDLQSQPTFRVTYKGVKYTGWYACCALINRAIDNGIPFTDCDYLRKLTFEQAKIIFTGDDGSVIPMLAERKSNLVEAAEVLIEKFDGTFLNCIEASGGSAQKLLRLIVDNFSSFRDIATYNGREVSLLKRAQILVADIYSCLNISPSSELFRDIDTLTMFADYRVPQVLAYFGVLEYSMELKDLLRKRHLFSFGDSMEVEIRGCSVEAVERLVAKTNEILRSNCSNKTVNAATVDNFLWCYRRAHAARLSSVPFHLVRCIYY